MKVSTDIKDKFAILKFETDQVLGYEGQEFQDTLLSSLEKKINYVIIDLSKVKIDSVLDLYKTVELAVADS